MVDGRDYRRRYGFGRGVGRSVVVEFRDAVNRQWWVTFGGQRTL
jgi:hypothetical protein